MCSYSSEGMPYLLEDGDFKPMNPQTPPIELSPSKAKYIFTKPFGSGFEERGNIRLKGNQKDKEIEGFGRSILHRFQHLRVRSVWVGIICRNLQKTTDEKKVSSR